MNTYNQGDKVTVQLSSGEYDATVLSQQGDELFVRFSNGGLLRVAKNAVTAVANSIPAAFKDALDNINWG